MLFACSELVIFTVQFSGPSLASLNWEFDAAKNHWWNLNAEKEILDRPDIPVQYPSIIASILRIMHRRRLKQMEIKTNIILFWSYYQVKTRLIVPRDRNRIRLGSMMILPRSIIDGNPYSDFKFWRCRWKVYFSLVCWWDSQTLLRFTNCLEYMNRHVILMMSLHQTTQPTRTLRTQMKLWIVTNEIFIFQLHQPWGWLQCAFLLFHLGWF